MSIYGPGKPSSRVSDNTQDLRIYAKKSYAVSRDGDRMLGDLDMNGYAVKNLPEVPQTGTDACSAAFARAIGQECVTRNGDQGMQANLDMDGNKIVKLRDPTNGRDGANKRYVDAHVKPYITIWAERNGPFTGPYQFSFGGGSTGRDQHHCGYVMMSKGRVMRMGLAATTNLGQPAGDIKVTLVHNGQPHGRFHLTKRHPQFSEVTVFDSPLELNPGDKLGFMSSREDYAEPNATAVIVSALIQLDL